MKTSCLSTGPHRLLKGAGMTRLRSCRICFERKTSAQNADHGLLPRTIPIKRRFAVLSSKYELGNFCLQYSELRMLLLMSTHS